LSTDTPQNVAAPESIFEESTEELYEMAPCGYLTTTIEGRIVKVNKTLVDWLGYERAELTGGKGFTDLLTVGGRIFYETHFNLLLHVKTSVDEIALDLICKDGRTLPTLINARQKRDSAGAAVVNRFTIFNASERRLYERELLAARDLLRITLASIGDGVISTDGEGRVNFMNAVAEALSGWSVDAARGRPVEEVVVLVHEDSGAVVENPVSHALRVGMVVGLANHTILVSRDGRRIRVDDSASPIRDAAGSIIGGVLVFRDISQRRKAEELERAQQEQGRETARLTSLGLMAGGIAHDFNNLLTAVLGNASLLAESVSEREAGLVNEIIYAGERAARLTKQMLAYSGQDWLEITKLDLDAHIRDSFALLRAALPAGVNITLALAGPAGCVTEADPAQIQQVIMNLLINAAEAVPEDSGEVAIRTGFVAHRPERFSPNLQAVVPGGTYAIVEIQDNGTGMSPDTLKKIFDPFFTTKFLGRGLGLSAALGIVKAHRGDIEVESEPGVGSVFRVFLPAAHTVSPVLVPENKATAVEKFSALAPPSCGTVLVVDDEEIIRRLAAGALQSRRMHVLVARNGQEALEILEAEPAVTAVILDVTMPVMSGEAALPLINALRPGLPVIISSGFNEAEVLRRFGSSQVAGVLPKPYTVDAIVSKVMAVLQAAD
jgi:PAS domain S-box-containing protein